MAIDPQPSRAERIAIAVVLGVLGFVTGLIAVWIISDLPGVRLGRGVFLGIAIAAGLACMALGYRASDRTTDALGEVWGVLWKLSLGILGAIRSLIR